MFNNVLKIFGGISTIAIIGALILVFFEGEIFFKDKINEFLYEKTEGIYQIKYDDIDIGFFDGDIKIYGFNLQFDTIKANKKLAVDSTSLFFNIHVKEFDILNFKYKKMFDLQEIQMNELRLNTPKISTYGVVKLDQNNVVFSYELLLKTIFKEINIDKISFENAGYKMYSHLFNKIKFYSAKRIDILIDKFHSSSELIESNQYFEIKDLAIRFLDFNSILGDDIYTLKADTLDFSLKKSYLNMSNLSFSPFKKIENQDYFEFDIPKLNFKLKNINLFDSIIVDELKVNEPKVRYFKREIYGNDSIIAHKDIEEFKLCELIKNKFNKVAINNLQINDANFLYYKKENLIQKISEVDFELTNFSIDSVSEINPSKIFYSDNFKFDFNKFQLNMVGNDHIFKIDHFQISSKKKNVKLNDVTIHPNTSKSNHSEELNLNTKEIIIKNIDFKKLFNDKSLIMDELLLSNIDIEDKLYSAREIENSLKLEDVLEPILNKVEAKKVHLNNAYIDFNDLRFENKHGKFKGEINFQLNDFNVDIKNVHKNTNVLFSDKFRLVADNYIFKSPKDVNVYKAKRVELNNYTNEILVDDVTISPELKGEYALELYDIASLINLSANQIKVKDIDFNKAVFESELFASNLKIEKPTVDITVYNKYKKHKKFNPKEIEGVFYTALNYLPQVNINRIDIPNGEVRLKTIDDNNKIKINIHNEFNIQMDDFLFSEDELTRKEGKDNIKTFFSDNAIFTVENQIFNIGDGVHKISADEISFHSKDNSLYIKNALMYPDLNSEKYNELKELYQLKIPELDIIGFDIEKAIETNNDTISIGKVNLKGGEINLISRSKDINNQKKFTLKDFYLPLPDNIKELRLGELNVLETKVETYKKERKILKPKLKSCFNISSKWGKIILTNKGVGKGSDFKVDDASYHISNMHIPLNNQSDLKIKDLRFDVRKGDFIIKNISFNKKNEINIAIEEFILSEIDYKKLYNHDFDVKSIIINNPLIKINNSHSTSEKSFSKIDLLNGYPIIEDFFNYIKVDNVKINNADLQINDFKQKNVNLIFEEVSIDDKFDKDRFLYTKNIILNIQDINRKFGLYDLNVDNIQLTTTPFNLKLNKIDVKPSFTKQEYINVVKDQVDRVEASIDYLSFNKIDYYKWFAEGQIIVDSIAIGPSEVDLYKDTRVKKIIKVKPLPQELLNKINKEFYVKSLIMKPSKLNYLECSGSAPGGGRVYMDSLKLYLSNITNIKTKLLDNHKMSATAQSLLMGLGELNVKLDFDMLSKNELQRIKGSLTNFPLTSLNKIIEDAAGIRIREGYTQKIEFDMNLTNEEALGSVNLKYDSLNIALLNKEHVKEQKFISGLANVALGKKSSKKQEEKDNIVYLERDDKKSFIGYWWRSILSGIIYSFGLSSKEQRDIKRGK